MSSAVDREEKPSCILLQNLLCIFDTTIWGDSMDKRWVNLLISISLGLIVPLALFSVASLKSEKANEGNAVEATEPFADNTGKSKNENERFYLSVLMDDGAVQTMDLDAYITGVVLAEMPADFEIEALKAQAVVARTYALRRYEENVKHSSASVCTNAACCQGYTSEDDYLQAGKTLEDLEKIRQAVQDTKQNVLMFRGGLIEATYFSCSGGQTEDASAVWGSDVPYLQAIQSPGEEKATHYTDTVYYTFAEFQKLLGEKFSQEPAKWFGGVTYTDGGGVKTMHICGKQYTGTHLRRILGLRSTAFTVEISGNSIKITTKGYGHRVGMSQYGADAMAVNGSHYQEILEYYYQGAEVVTYTG